VTQQSTLSPERWASFTLDQQILMIANEMNRAGKLLGPDDRSRLRNSHERVLNLTDLTVAVQDRPALRRELLRWRDLVAELYIAADPDRRLHEAAFEVLKRFTPGVYEATR
jgi:hypothetical protein